MGDLQRIVFDAFENGDSLPMMMVAENCRKHLAEPPPWIIDLLLEQNRRVLEIEAEGQGFPQRLCEALGITAHKLTRRNKGYRDLHLLVHVGKHLSAGKNNSEAVRQYLSDFKETGMTSVFAIRHLRRLKSRLWWKNKKR